jgi:hypothetical protein
MIIEDQNEGFVAEYLKRVSHQPLHGLIRQLEGDNDSFEFRSGVQVAFDCHLKKMCSLLMRSGIERENIPVDRSSIFC